MSLRTGAVSVQCPKPTYRYRSTAIPKPAMRCPNDLKARAKSTLQFGGRLRKSRSLGVSLPVTELPRIAFVTELP